MVWGGGHCAFAMYVQEEADQLQGGLCMQLAWEERQALANHVFRGAVSDASALRS